MWRVRTIGGASPSVTDASATSQESVELWVLMISGRTDLNARRIARTPRRLLRPMESARCGMARRSASARIPDPATAQISTSCPRAIIPCVSSSMRISWPPQPTEASVCAIRSGVRFNAGSIELTLSGSGAVHLRRKLFRVLQPMEHRVDPGSGNEIGVLSGFGDAARIQNDDAVGPLDGGQAVRDHQRRAAAHERFQRRLNVALRFAVECG